jgi:hypothetical protein
VGYASGVLWTCVGCDSALTVSGKDPGRDADAAVSASLDHFSFFVTSVHALQQLSGSQSGFGGDLRYGEEGELAGIHGADKICAAIAETSMPGSAAKKWRAFLSASTGGEDGGPTHAIERVGSGPWYDRIGRVVALTKQDLRQTRPGNADPAIVDDLPNEEGLPNHAPDPTASPVDNHDMLTGSDTEGHFYGSTRATCQDWTSAVGMDGNPRVGHWWPRSGTPLGFFPFGGDAGLPSFAFPDFSKIDGGFSGFFQGLNHWASSLDEAGCAPGVNIVEMGPPDTRNPTVGSGGGYGGFYCFALTP